MFRVVTTVTPAVRGPYWWTVTGRGNGPGWYVAASARTPHGKTYSKPYVLFFKKKDAKVFARRLHNWITAYEWFWGMGKR